jgi:hypothetical protein
MLFLSGMLFFLQEPRVEGRSKMREGQSLIINMR